MSEERSLSEYQIRDLEEKRRALAVIEKQFPEMSELRAVLRDNPKEFRNRYPIALTNAVSKKLGVPMSGIDILGGKPYVNKTGLTYKVQKDPRRVKCIKAVPVLYPMKVNLLNTPDDPDFKKFFVGFSEDGTAVSHGIVEFEDGSRFEDEGSANAKYLNKQWGKMSTMVPYINELASTRATNRAMRLATGIGLVSVEELNERGYSLVKENMTNEVSDNKIRLIASIEDLYRELRFNEAKRVMWNSKFGGVPDLGQIDEKNLEKLLFAIEPLRPKSKPKKIGAKYANKKPATKKSKKK